MGCSVSRLLLVVVAGCGSGGGIPDAPQRDAPNPTGTFSLAWTLTDAASQPLGCDPIGAESVTVLAHNRAVEGGLTEVFTCATGMGQSQGVLPGVYDLDFELRGTVGVIASAPGQHGVTVAANGNTPLDPVAFAMINDTGGLALTIDSGKTGGNCGTVGTGGAGITATTITVVRASDSACEPVTFTISAGATMPAGSYTVNCATPVAGPCIENDQTLSAASVASDAYTVHVRGDIAAAVCYSNNDGIQVPPIGTVLTRTLNLGYAAGTPGC